MSDFDTREISDIKIEDPLNFLTAAEKEAYIRAQDAERMKAKREELSRTQELQQLEEERIEREHRRSREEAARRARARKRRAMERRRAEEEREDKIEKVVRIASIVTGSIILVLLLVIAGSLLRNYFSDRAEENQIAADADGSVVPGAEDGDPDAGAVEVEGFTAMNDTVTTTTDLRLRSTPDSSVDNNIVAKATRGTELKRTGINETIGWSRVEYDGRTLYCATKYLQ